MTALEILATALAVLVAAGIPTAFVFGRGIGREDERTKLPELRPGAPVRFRPRGGEVTRFVVRDYTSTFGGTTIVTLQDEFSATAERIRVERPDMSDVLSQLPLDERIRNGL